MTRFRDKRAQKYRLANKSRKELATIAYFIKACGSIELDQGFPLVSFRALHKFVAKFANLLDEEAPRPSKESAYANVFISGERAVVLAALIRKYLPRDLATEADKLIEWYSVHAKEVSVNAQNQENHSN